MNGEQEIRSPASSRRYVEYVCEALGLGLFMMSAGIFGTMLENPTSSWHQYLDDPQFRRVLIGLAMGMTAIALIYSPWGRRSGAHNNPAVTITFWSLGKVKTIDACGYVVAQFVGAMVGTFLVGGLFGEGFV